MFEAVEISHIYLSCRDWLMHIYIVKWNITQWHVQSWCGVDFFLSLFCQAVDYTEAMVKRFLHICDVVNYGSLHITIVCKVFNFFWIIGFLNAILKSYWCIFWRNAVSHICMAFQANIVRSCWAICLYGPRCHSFGRSHVQGVIFVKPNKD